MCSWASTSHRATFHRFVRARLGTTHDRHEDLAALVTGLPDDALAWTPCADAPALAGLVLHILDVEGHLAAIAAGEDDHWAGENGSHILDSATGAALRDAILRSRSTDAGHVCVDR